MNPVLCFPRRPIAPLKDLGSLKSRVHTQVCHNNMGGVSTLLEVGGSIDIRDKAQRTLLHRACEEVINRSRFSVAPPSSKRIANPGAVELVRCRFSRHLE